MNEKGFFKLSSVPDDDDDDDGDDDDGDDDGDETDITRKYHFFAFIYECCFLFCKQEDSCTYPPDNYA